MISVVTGLNHITLSVAELQRSYDFYVDLLGFTPRARWTNGAYLELDSLWLCLSEGSSAPATDYTHLAFSVEENSFTEVIGRLAENNVHQWQQNISEGDSFYFLDPDGHKLEVHIGNLETRLASMNADVFKDLVVFDEQSKAVS